MDVLAKSREILEALTTFPYYVVLPPTQSHASWQEASAIAYALECIGSSSEDLPSRLGATRVTVNPKASSVEDAVTRYSRTTIALDPHTDTSQHQNPHSIVIFGMSRPDEIGGETQMVVVDELLPLLDSKTAELLRQPIWPMGKQPKPILETGSASDETRISYYRKQLDRSLELGASLSAQQMTALSALDAAITHLSAQRSFRLQKGETLLINNRKVLHGRTALAEDSDRLMIRYRLRTDFTACHRALNAEGLPAEHIRQRVIHGASRLEEQGRKTQARILRSDERVSFDALTTPSSVASSTEPLTPESSMTEVRRALRAKQFNKAQSLLQLMAQKPDPGFDVPYFLSALATRDKEDAKAAALLENAAAARPFLKTGRESLKPVVLKVRAFEGTKVKFRFADDGALKTRLVGGQISTKYWIDKARFHITLGNAANREFSGANLPRFDVLFNAISDVDASPNALLGLEGFIANHGVTRVINEPAALRRSTRDNIAKLANASPHLRSGRTNRYLGSALLDVAKLVKQITSELTFPLLVRSVGTHTGSTLSKCDTDVALRESLKGLSSKRDLYVTEFINVANEQGVFHKIRGFYIDGDLYPVHLLRAEHWEVGRRGDRLKIMSEQTWMQEDEASCLNDLAAYLGATHHSALLAFLGDIGLDFCGVDFAVGPDGKLVIFEANPAMRHHYDHVKTAPYIKPAHDRASEAFNEMIQRRISPS
ncbi:TauD/TfdA family dioxygenase [Luminiphilus sp.]|nr:TauD/TfdA family dioxygenase [Luminiphilus sp.]